MNPLLIFSIFIVPFFKDAFAGIGNSKTAKAIFLLIGGYFLYSYFAKKQKEAEYLSGNSRFGEWAKRMHAALHPVLPYKVPEWIPILGGYFDDGTNETEVISIAKEVGLVKGRTDLIDAYKVLFGDDLEQSLLNDDVLTEFNAAYNSASGVSTVPTPTTRYIKAGNEYKVRAGYNVRQFDNVGKPVRKTIENEYFDVVEIWKNKTLSGVKDTFCRCRKYSNIYKIGFTEYWVALGAFKP